MENGISEREFASLVEIMKLRENVQMVILVLLGPVLFQRDNQLTQFQPSQGSSNPIWPTTRLFPPVLIPTFVTPATASSLAAWGRATASDYTDSTRAGALWATLLIPWIPSRDATRTCSGPGSTEGTGATKPAGIYTSIRILRSRWDDDETFLPLNHFNKM